MNTQQLVESIKLANTAYAVGRPYMTDTEYDELWNTLYKIDPDNSVLYHTAQDPNLSGLIRPHAYPVRGTLKAFEQDDLLPFLTRFGTETLVLQPKYDGCAAMLYKQPNEDWLLIKEGDGKKGEDITRHLGTIKASSVHKLRANNSIEILITNADWNPSFGANQRNVAAGWINSGTLPPHACLTIVPHNNGPLEERYSYDGNLDALTTKLLRLYTEWSKTYPLDGIMIKVASEKRRQIAGDNGRVYNWSLAWKPPIQTAETTVTDIEWNVSRSGRVIPTVIYEPIELCGTVNSRVTANNALWLKEKDIAPGNVLTVGKAGEIIPKIIDCSCDYCSNIPSCCPVCGAPLEWSGVDLVCNAPDCIAQLTKRLAHFYSDKGMEIKSIGEKRIEELLQKPTLYRLLKNRPWWLLCPNANEDEGILYQTWGHTRFKTFLRELDNLYSTRNMAHFIAALGYPGLAYKTALKLCQAVMQKAPMEKNVSQKSITSFCSALHDWYVAQEDLSSFKFAPLPKVANTKFCITGTLEAARSDVVNELQELGWAFVNQVSKSVDYLVVGEGHENTTKHRKALELRVPILTEEDLWNLVKEKP